MADARYESPKHRRTSVRRFSPRKDDSPSRQLGFELEKALEQLQIHDFERQKVHAYNRRSYHEELDAKDLAMAKAHMEALEAANAKHEAVRQEAEAVLQRHLKEQEEKRQREEAEERLRQEREARERAERERKAKEEAERRIRLERERREAEARKAAEEKARAEAAEAERKQREEAAQRAKEESVRVEKERIEKEATIKAQAEKDAAEKQRARQAVAAVRPIPSEPGFYSTSQEAEAQHSEYLVLHKKLKTFRKEFWESAKQNKPLKTAVGDMRRALRTSVGQLTDDKVGNKKATERVKAAIIQAMKEIPSPEVSISDFLPAHLSLNDQGSTKIPSLVIYLMSILSKAIINAFTGECAVNTKAAEPIGTLTAQVFSLNELQFQRQNATTPSQSTVSLISVLLAKLHKVAPILFGISGPETTAQGRYRLGWRAEGDSQKAFIPEQRQHERMTGLGAGFSSIALRNFSKTRLRNPFPPTHFWTALAGIVNTPPNDVQTSHLLLLKSMLDNNAAERFVLFFGSVAVAAIREALIDFPKRLPETIRSKPACRSLQLMVDAMEKEKHFRLV